jgi:hypothetical protein
VKGVGGGGGLVPPGVNPELDLPTVMADRIFFVGPRGANDAAKCQPTSGAAGTQRHEASL